VPDAHGDVATAIRDLTAALARARSVMRTVEVSLADAARELDSGAHVTETFSTPRVSELRSELNSALDDLAATRHRFRLALVSECAGSGMNAREVSELWGFSRQRAAQLIQETRRPPGTTEGVTG